MYLEFVVLLLHLMCGAGEWAQDFGMLNLILKVSLYLSLSLSLSLFVLLVFVLFCFDLI